MSVPRSLPWRRKVGRIAAVVAFVPLEFVVSHASGASEVSVTAASHPSSTVPDPLAGSVADPTTGWAVVQMGKNDGQGDLFWQLFSINGATGRVALATPPGVATNGGLMIGQAAKGPSALVGFGVSQDLVFSPLALSADSGRSWSPGGLEQGLVASPSALGFDRNGDAFAVLEGDRQAVVERSGALTSWKTVVETASLATTPAGERCQVVELDAVAVAADDRAQLGAVCRAKGVPGIFVRGDATWRLAEIPVPAPLRHDAFSTLRLEPSSALLAAVGATTSVVAAWQSSVRAWSLSPALVVPSSAALVATGSGPDGSQFVLWRDHGTEQAEAIGGPGARWRPLPTLPDKTATAAYLPNGQVDASSVNDTRCTVWHLGTTASQWTKSQVINVPIEFGSSS